MSCMHCARADAQPRVRMRMCTPRPSVGRPHVRTTAGTLWNLYPMYDYAHALTDAIEGVTHSLCSLEFENHRELYDWVVRECDVPSTPRQIEFSRLNLQYTARARVTCTPTGNRACVPNVPRRRAALPAPPTPTPPPHPPTPPPHPHPPHPPTTTRTARRSGGARG